MPKKKVSFKSLKYLEDRQGGLSESEVTAQRSRFGKNEIVEVSGNPWLNLIRDTLKDYMIWFILIIGGAFAFVGDYREATVLFIAVLPLIFMDAFLQKKIQASTTTLRAQLATEAIVLRSGQKIKINTVDVVPGDVVFINSGDHIPADGFFESTRELQVDESALTGESLPVAKKKLQINPFSLADNNLVSVDAETLGFAGSRILAGSAQLRVLFTGRQTSYGEIVQSVNNIQQERTPLQNSIARLVGILIFAAIGFCIFLAVIRIYQGHGWLDALLTSATLAMAAIPEEFPVVFTFFLGLGVYRLAKKKALVRRAVSIENIGRVTAICTDKTGTLTLGQLKLVSLEKGTGIQDEDLLVVAAVSSKSMGTDPVDQAIWEMVQRNKLKVPERVTVFPFTEGKKREAAFAYDLQGEAFCYMKGAPETVLSVSNLSPDVVSSWLAKTSELAKQGNKVLACARKRLTDEDLKSKIEPTNNYDFCGLLGFADTPRPEVAEAISYCNQSSIGVWMLTGDHIDTAMAIATQVKLNGSQNLEGISAEDEPFKLEAQFLNSNPDFLKKVHVIARCSPMQKLEIVKALRQNEELVAVTGDGVNDVPALKFCDVGIAMGDGTRSAKEVSSIILADNNFATIVNAIKEGRQLFLNLKMSFVYLLLFHIPFVVSAAIIPLLGYPLLYLPVHIVWLELLIHPTALFAFVDDVKKGGTSLDSQTQKNRNKNFFSKSEGLHISFLGIAISLAVTISFVRSYIQSSDVYHARAQALTLLIFWGAGIVLFMTLLRSKVSRIIFFTTVFSTYVAVQTPSISEFLNLVPLHFQDWIYILLNLLIISLAISLWKKTRAG